MGALTATQIITQGLNQAGDSSLSALALPWLNQWLKKTYAGWLWPFCQKTKLGISLPTGTASLVVGVGSSGITLPVLRIYDPVLVYTGSYSTRAEARLKTLNPQAADNDPDLAAPTERGLPSYVVARQDTGTWGRWTLQPWPLPDKDYLVKLVYQEQPADLGTSDIPIYPNDETMAKAVEVAALGYISASDKSYLQRFQYEGGQLRYLVSEDRIAFGTQDGLNESFELDAGVFRGVRGGFYGR